MAGFEDLIRGALIKQGDPTPDVRAKVYASARQALKRMIASNPELGEEVIAAQRVKLEKAIDGIEQSYVKDFAAGQTTAPAPDPTPIPEPAKHQEPQPEPEKTPQPEQPATIAEPEDVDSKVEAATTAQAETATVSPELSESAIPPPQAENPPEEPPVVEPVVPERKVSEKKTPVAEEPKPEPEPEPEAEPETTETEISIPKIPLSAPSVGAAATAPGMNSDVDVEEPSVNDPATAFEPLVEEAREAPAVNHVTDHVGGPTGNRSNARIEPDLSEMAGADPEPAVGDDEPKVLQPVRLQTEPPEEDVYPDTYRGNALKDKKPYAKLLLWTIILAGIGVAIWWAINFGPALLKAQLDGSVPNPQPTIESGSFVPGAVDKDGWITVFTPDASAGNVVTKGNSAVELQRNGARQVMRMASPDGKVDNNVLVKVPRDVMETIKGQAATVEITVSSPTAENQEYVLFCEFSQMGNCGRKRFIATEIPDATVFDVLVNDVALPAGDEAFISINTDFSGQGRSLDLHSIRVRTGS